MFHLFTDQARRVVVQAQEEARTLRHYFVGTEHILLGLIHEGGLGTKALESLGISPQAVRQRVGEVIGGDELPPPPGPISFTSGSKKVLELSLAESRGLGHQHIGTEHILLGLIREGDGVAAHVLTELGADLTGARDQVIRLVEELRGQHGDQAG